jgi:hypothetical protein
LTPPRSLAGEDHAKHNEAAPGPSPQSEVILFESSTRPLRLGGLLHVPFYPPSVRIYERVGPQIKVKVRRDAYRIY